MNYGHGHVPMTIGNRLKEIFCVIFGHDWNEYGSRKSDTGRILEEYSKCGSCGLENHDRSGFLLEYNERFNRPSGSTD